MLIYYKKKDFIEALDDFNKLKSVSPSSLKDYYKMESELNYQAEIKKKQMTDEMLGKLKDVGQSFLGMFGVDINSFKVQQSNNGGYSLQYQPSK